MEADPPARALGFPEQVADRVEHHGEVLLVPSVLLFQRVQLPCEVGVGQHQLPQPYERAHDLDVDPHCALGPQDTRQHGDALLGERDRWVATTTPTRDHSL